MNSTIIWYVARSSGIVAWALLAASVIWGLAVTTRLFRRRPRPAWLVDLHRFLAGSALVFLVIHVGSILLDTYTHFSLVNVLVPLTGSWHPGAVAWGIVAMYFVLAVEVTSQLRARLPRRVWRSVHYLSFPVFVSATVHAVTAGTDRHTIVMRAAVFVVCGVVAALTGVRLLARGGRSRSPVRKESPGTAGVASTAGIARADAA